MKKQFLAAALITFLVGSVSAFAADGPTKKADGVLVAENGMTLYVFDKDMADSGKSNCNGPCLALWPALLAKEVDKAAGDYTIITRDDGAKQWALKGKPLYFWSNDKKPGDKTGDKFKDVWHVIPQ